MHEEIVEKTLIINVHFRNNKIICFLTINIFPFNKLVHNFSY